MRIIKYLKDKIYPIYSKYYCRVKVVEGILKGNNEKVRCLFSDYTNFNLQLGKQIFLEPPKLIRTWRIPRHKLLNILKERKIKDVDMGIIERPIKDVKGFEETCSFKIPPFVMQIIELKHPYTIKKLSHRAKDTRRLIRNNNFSTRISYSEKDFDLFYYDMYLPYLKKFGEYSVIIPYEILKSKFKKGYILYAMQNDIAVAGSINIHQDNQLIGERLGVLNGNNDFVKMGALSVLYHYLIEFAKENNVDFINLGQSLPFCNDGVYIAKHLYGAAINNDEGKESWIFLYDFGHSRKISCLFEANPAIIDTPKGLMVVVGLPEEREYMDDELYKQSKNYYTPGLAGVIFIVMGENIKREIYFE